VTCSARVLIASVLAALLGITLAPPASAATPVAVISNTPTQVPFAQTNGDVSSLAVLPGGEVAFGGDFTTVTPPGGTAHAATNFAVVNETTGAVVFAGSGIASTGYVRAMAYSNGVLYVAGSFTTFDGVNRKYAVALTVPGFAVTSWNPAPSNYLNAIQVDSHGVYLAGATSTVRSVSLGSGSTQWSVKTSSGGVRALLINPAMSSLYVGGFFATIGGVAQHGLAKLSENSGAVDPAFDPVLAPNVPITSSSGEDPVSLGLDTYTNRLITGSGGEQNWVRERSLTTGANAWDRGSPGDTQAVINLGQSVVLGFHRNRPNQVTFPWQYFTDQLAAGSGGAMQAWTSGLAGRDMNVTDGLQNGVRALAFDTTSNLLIVGGAFLNYGATCNPATTLACSGGKPMRSLAEYRVSLS
jgi:hypothetical protein